MISTSDVSLYFDSRKLFDEVSIKFSPGNCYGVIGANGAGKSTFLKILSSEVEPSKGSVHIPKDISLSVLKQDHFQYNHETVLDTVLLGHERLIAISKEKDAIYAKAEMTEEDGVRASELEIDFANLGGWEAETDAATLLHGLGIGDGQLSLKMEALADRDKIKVLLAQALFGKPDVLLLDEPTNHLDAKSIAWLENYLLDYDKTVIVISHDRHFLNKVCTYMVDIDHGAIKVYVGNYDFWLQTSELSRNLRAQENKKKEQKAKDLEAFIRRFSANAAKSKQATARRKMLDNLTLDDIPQSMRKHPHIVFQPEREAGDILLEVEGLSKSIDGVKVLDNISFEVLKGQKIAFVGLNEQAHSLLFDILTGKIKSDSGSFRWGVTTTRAYLPKEYDELFQDCDNTLIDWLREFSEDKSEHFIRGFLGRMLFSGDETLKKAKVLSGGEKVRCMLAKMMLLNANVLLLDGPTNHLDLESITSLNNALVKFPGTILLMSHDQEFVSSIANRLLEVRSDGKLNNIQLTYEQYLLS